MNTIRNLAIPLKAFFLLGTVVAQEFTSLTPIADAPIAQANPEANYETNNLVVGRFDSQPWESLIRFDLSTIPSGAVVQSANFRFRSTSFGSGGTLRLSKVNADWLENSLAWNNRPGTTSISDIPLTLTAVNDARLHLDGPAIAQLQEMLSGEVDDFGFHLSFPGAEPDQNFGIQSRESSSPPELIINYEISPPNEVLNATLRTGTAPAGWTSTQISYETAAGGYARLDEITSTIVTPTLDASAYETLDLSFAVAKWGTGVNGPVLVEYSLDAGANWITLGNSPIPTDANYLPADFQIPQTSSQFILRFSRPGSESRKRLRDIVLIGNEGDGPPPSAPPTLAATAPAGFTAGEGHGFTFTATDPEGGTVELQIDWGDGTVTDWLGPFASGAAQQFERAYSAQGNYTVRVKARNDQGAESEWTVVRTVVVFPAPGAPELFYESAFSETAMALIPNDGPGSDPDKPMRAVWSTEPGVRYQLERSTDLQGWTVVQGFPSEAAARSQQHAFQMAAGGSAFFRVRPIDEQPPIILNRFPLNGALGVGRFSDILVALDDLTGIDPDSISMQVSGLGSFTLSSQELSMDGANLTFSTGGDSALGGWGDTITVTLVAADVLGNEDTFIWEFILERQVELEGDVFVFGTPEAVRAGQELTMGQRAIAMRVLGERPLPMNTSLNPWTITEVGDDFIRIQYQGDVAPQFQIDQRLANVAPIRENEAFYRRVTAIETIPTQKEVLLSTQNISLLDIVREGAKLITNPIGALFEIAEDGLLVDVGVELELIAGISETVELKEEDDGSDPDDPDNPSGPSIGATMNYSYDVGFSFKPSIDVSFNIANSELQDFYLKAGGELSVFGDFSIDANTTITASFSPDAKWFKAHPWMKKSKIKPLGFIGPVPIWLEVGYTVKPVAGFELGVGGSFSYSFQHTRSRYFEVAYDANNPSQSGWQTFGSTSMGGTTGDPVFTTSVNGKGWAGIEPSIRLRLMHLAGVETKLPFGVEIEADATVTNGQLSDYNWSALGYIDFVAGLSVIGFSDPLFPFKRRLFEYPWSGGMPTGQLAFITQPPSNVTVAEGDLLSLQARATGNGPVSYEWFKDGQSYSLFAGERLQIPYAKPSDSGSYQVVARSGGQPITSSVANVSVVPLGGGGPTDPNMIPVQGGTLAMSMGTVTVGTFQIGKFEVTWGEWKAVRADATARGYDIGNIGAGCADDHPVRSVNWYDVVKWCNLKSEIEGLTPVYTLSGATYKTGQSIPAQNLSASGYRLPTEAEWEFAARGGIHSTPTTYSGSNTIRDVAWFWDNANGEDGSGAACPLSAGRGTWPVGGKAPNELGLHDMSGNVWEWCWDANSSNRRIRGGGWYHDAIHCTVSRRNHLDPDHRHGSRGFRLGRSSGN